MQKVQNIFKKLLFAALVCASLLLPAVSSLAVTFKYDDLNRLIEVRYDNGDVIAYTYDAAGNRTSETVIKGS